MLNRGMYLMLSSLNIFDIQCGFMLTCKLRTTINSEDLVDNRYGCEILLEMYYRFLAPASSSYLQLALKGHNTQHSGHMGQNFSI